MSLAPTLASHGSNDIENDSILFLRSRQLKCGATWLCYAIGTVVSVTWCWWHHQWYHSIPYVTMIEMKCSIMFWSCATIGIAISSMWCWCHCEWHLCIVRSRWLKWGTIWLFWSCHSLMLAISIVKGSTTFLASRQSQWGGTRLFVDELIFSRTEQIFC